MSKIITINADQTKAEAKVSGVDKKIKIKAVEHKEGGCDNCIFFENYQCTIPATEPSYCTPTRQDKKNIIWVEDKGEENEVITNKTNIKMEAKPKYNVGDTAIIRTKEEYRIGKIASISIQGNKIYYYFENIAGKYPEDVVTRYSKNVEEEPKAETKQQEAPVPTTELPKTYEEAVRNYTGNVYYRHRDTVFYESDSDRLHTTPYSISGETCEKLMQFEKLIFLRDIYRQDWVPDRLKTDLKYVLLCIYNNVKKGTEIGYNKVLSFQSEEIRDEFYNNFRELIEECKEFI